MATGNSMIPPGEDESWAQTFVTVTPHEDGFLREISENVVVSGSADSPLQLDTWNIALRRSLVKGTREWIEPGELERSSRVGAECQTYLQGVPRVELPLAYADEATQTLYMGRDGAAFPPMRYFDDIIGVLNAKSLPELRISHAVQTAVSASGDGTDGTDGTDVVGKLLENAKSTTPSDLPPFAETSEREAARTEAMDVLNFVVERTLWMTRPGPPPPQPSAETRDVGVQTLMKYDHRLARLLIDFEAQTELTCKPSSSNSKLLGETVNDDDGGGVVVVVDETATGSPRTESQTRKVARSSDTVGREKATTRPVELIVTPIVTVARGNVCDIKCPQRTARLKKRDAYSTSSSDSATSGSIVWSSSSSSSASSGQETCSSSRESLSVRDERALCALRSAFGTRLTGESPNESSQRGCRRSQSNSSQVRG